MKSRELPGHCFLICTGKSCKQRGNRRLKKALVRLLLHERPALDALVQETKCMGKCDKGPNLMAYPCGKMFCGVDKSQLEEIMGEVLPAQPSPTGSGEPPHP